MGYELLERITAVLTAAGLPAGEEYPGSEQQLDGPAAAVGLRELDPERGTAAFSVRVLSPRILGGWCCQLHAARAVEALWAEGLSCRTAEMEYLSGSDCFCVTVTASMTVAPGEEGWVPGGRWEILCGDRLQEQVVSFTAVRDLERRLLGTHWQSTPVGVTPGHGGWTIELVQLVTSWPEETAEPFTLTVRSGDGEQRYTGCCWNETRWAYTQGGLTLTRRGFALEREEM